MRDHDRRLVDLTALRVEVEQEIAQRCALLDRVRAEIDEAVATRIRANRAARGLRCSLAELVDDLKPATQEGPDR